MNSWYFAYGSNLWMEQMVRRTEETWPPDQPPRRARLPGWRFSFTMHDRLEVFGNVEPDGPGVLGVVYFCSEAGLQKLDVYETGYSRELGRVELESGESLDAFFYVALPAFTGPPGRPSDAYLARILRGAREQQLPEAYVREIERLATCG